MEWLRSSNNSNNDHHFVSLMRDKCSVVEWDDWWVRLCVCLCVCVSDREKESGPRGRCEDLVDKMRADRKSQPSREPFAPQDLYMCLRPSVSLSLAQCFVYQCVCVFFRYIFASVPSCFLRLFFFLPFCARPLGTCGAGTIFLLCCPLSFATFFPQRWIPIALICINTRALDQNLFFEAKVEVIFLETGTNK